MRWAYLEWQMKQISYLLLGINRKAARIAVREPRASDYVTMIQDLAELKEMPLRVQWRALKNHIDELLNHRDRLAHGVWVKHPDHKMPCLLLTKGKWQPDSGGPAYKARINPVAVPVTVEDLRSIVTAIDSLADHLRKIEDAVRALHWSSPGRSVGPPAPHRPRLW